MSPKEVRQDIIKNFELYRSPGLTTIEEGTPTWTHVDCRQPNRRESASDIIDTTSIKGNATLRQQNDMLCDNKLSKSIRPVIKIWAMLLFTGMVPLVVLITAWLKKGTQSEGCLVLIYVFSVGLSANGFFDIAIIQQILKGIGLEPKSK